MIFKILNILFTSKLNFFPPKKNKYLIFDLESKKILSKIFKLNKFSILHVRKEQINFFILLKTFLNLKFSYFDYIINYIKFTQPKLIITSIDNNIAFYKIKNELNVLTIFFQNGQRLSHNDIFSILRNKNKKRITQNFSVDLMNVFDQTTSNNFLKIIKGTTNISGSILNNDRKISKFKKNNKTLLFISLWREKKIEQDKTDLLLKILKNFSIKNNLKLIILGKYKLDLIKETVRANEEKIYYFNLLGNKIKFISNNSKRDTYKILDQSDIIVSTGSTLGIESLARQNKTIIISPFPNIYPLNKNYFTYYNGMRKQGPFWFNGFDKYSIEKLLKKVKNLKQSNWKKISKNFQNEIPKYDQGNRDLKKSLKSFLEKNGIEAANKLLK